MEKIEAKDFEKYNRKFLLSLFRVFLWWLILFEILNAYEILNHPLSFTWSWLITVGLFGWVIAEILMFFYKWINYVLILPLISMPIFLDAFWDIFLLYKAFHNYDKFLHFFNSALIAWVLFIVLREKFENAKFTKTFQWIIIISMTTTLWALYEIEEYAEDVLINHRLLRMGNSFDTGDDILMNLLWGIFMVVLLISYFKLRKFLNEK
ncbi:MAG: hypothetical protein ACD_4C00241G0003 [uncultured bacterium (gcode 4)]|uniref:DUF2238 domain-containing protein n=1 Tax=uncultured bacterium (gcode 4) TaxID=1234023 RepID=K2GT78_9BACT|nr:MAG: hypothetical protein ACD_4C00241G0003 [uncultured bacterium (gcode 4)]